MEIKKGELQIANVPVNEGGERIEPEAQAARHVMDVGVQISHGGEQVTGKAARDYPVQVIADGLTAGGVAQSLRSQCGMCKHHDAEGARKWMERNQFTEEGRALVQSIRAYLIQNSGEEDEIYARAIEGPNADDDAIMLLRGMGVCRAQSEIKRDTILTHVNAGCPKEMGPGGEDLSKLFTPRDRENDKMGASVYDAVMSTAQGKR